MVQVKTALVAAKIDLKCFRRPKGDPLQSFAGFCRGCSDLSVEKQKSQVKGHLWLPDHVICLLRDGGFDHRDGSKNAENNKHLNFYNQTIQFQKPKMPPQNLCQRPENNCKPNPQAQRTVKRPPRCYKRLLLQGMPKSPNAWAKQGICG